MMTEVLRYAAFTDSGIGGNPAGVVLEAGSLNDSEMLAIARDVGYSETACVVPIDSTTIRVRYFSPVAEVAFCGHATVATAVAMADRDCPGELDLATLAGLIRVTTAASGSGMVATLTGISRVTPSGRKSSRPRSDTPVCLRRAGLASASSRTGPSGGSHAGA